MITTILGLLGAFALFPPILSVAVPRPRGVRMNWPIVLVWIFISILFFLLAVRSASARDVDGRYAAQNPELHAWFESLRSGKGPCCADADGMVVPDANWESKSGHIRVRLPFVGGYVIKPDTARPEDNVEWKWVDVPDEAVLAQPNLYGHTMVWPVQGYLGVTVRCFLPGDGT